MAACFNSGGIANWARLLSEQWKFNVFVGVGVGGTHWVRVGFRVRRDVNCKRP